MKEDTIPLAWHYLPQVPGANIKVVYAWGFRDTPIDLAASVANGYTKYIDAAAFSFQHPAYFRADIRLSVKWNKARHTRMLSLDIQNTTNQKIFITKISIL